MCGYRIIFEREHAVMLRDTCQILSNQAVVVAVGITWPLLVDKLTFRRAIGDKTVVLVVTLSISLTSHVNIEVGLFSLHCS